jgi:DNA mismatch repair ATPase MutL
MVWNSLDADAENVSVAFRLNPLGGLEEIIVKDDGTGIPFDTESEHHFAALGGSWKARVARTTVAD